MECFSSRETFWIDNKLMAEFLKEPLNRQLYDVYMSARNSVVPQDFHTLQLFNEVYYLCARIVLEENERAELGDYIKIVKDDLGWNYPSSLVVNMVYCVLSLRRGNTKAVEILLEQIRHHYRMDTYETPFSRFVEDCKNRGESYDITFQSRSKRASSYLEIKDLLETGLNPIIQVEHADIKILSPGNLIGKTIQYGKQRE